MLLLFHLKLLQVKLKKSNLSLIYTLALTLKMWEPGILFFANIVDPDQPAFSSPFNLLLFGHLCVIKF